MATNTEEKNTEEKNMEVPKETETLIERDTSEIIPPDGTKSRKRLPSKSPDKEETESDRTGQRKFPRETEIMDCDIINSGTDVKSTDQGKTNFTTLNQNGSQAHEIADQNKKTDTQISIDFETLYDHCSTEKSLLSQLNKMSEMLKASNAIATGNQQSPVILTPLVKSFFQSPEKSNSVTANQISEGKFSYVPTTEEDNKHLPRENNLFLRAIANSIDSMQGLLQTNSECVNAVASRISVLESNTERSISDMSERLMETENSCIQNKGGINEIYVHIDDRISALKDAIPETMAVVCKEYDTRLDNHDSELKKVQSTITDMPTHESIAEKFEQVFAGKLAKLEETSFSRISALENRVQQIETKLLPNNSVTKGDLEKIILRVSQLETDMRRELDRIKDSNSLGSSNQTENIDNLFVDRRKNNSISKSDLHKQKVRVDEMEDRIEGLESDLTTYKKTTDSLRNQLRKDNVIIDQLQEVEGEDVLGRINTILDLTLTAKDRAEIQIKKAFRLGVKRAEGQARKILVEVKCGREILFEKARVITKSGNDGRPYYINDDVPESVKRRRSDIHKYVLHLRERGHQAEKAGEDVIIDHQRWKFEDLNNLPIGDRLMDSRTIYNCGAVAFQSAVSPLSNLFLCDIRMNNMVFKSSEQCYQYAKAMHHNMISKANKIRREPDSHVNMSDGGLITEDPEWREKKFRVMESIIRHKIEQVPIFRDTLRQTSNHKLIENSWSFVWGTGCPFRAPCVWDGSYKGYNHMGCILERVRDSTW